MKRRLLPIALLLLLALLAFLGALGVNQGISVALTLPPDVHLDGPATDDSASGPGADGVAARSDGRSRTKDQYIDRIVKRNLFDHDSIGVVEDDGIGGGQVTDLDVRLVATIVAEPAQFSSALIADDGKKASAVGYGIGDDLHGRQIFAIEQKRVTLKLDDGTLEYLVMGQGEKPKPRTANAGSDEGGVEELSENTYAVDRELIDKYTNDIDALSSMARALPHKTRDGDIDGYRMSGIRRKSLAEQLGLKNGDVIHSVNGSPLTSIADAMNAYSSLQSDSAFAFEVTRRGQKLNLSYEVR